MELISPAMQLARDLYETAEGNEFEMTKLRLTINAVMEGIESYEALSMEGESPAIDSVRESMEGALRSVKIIKSRGFLMKYLKANGDKKELEEVIDLLNTALAGLETKIQLANDGAVRGQNITTEQINKEAMKKLKKTEAGQIFWRDFVIDKSWVINTQKIAFYLKKYIEHENLKLDKNEQIKLDNLQLALGDLLDQDSDGTVTPQELADFFMFVWDQP